jgi:serine/threonine protein kinase
VIDDWVGKHTVGERLEAEPWRAAHLPRLLLDVAQGLAALHAVGIVFRELAPARVLIADQGTRAVLTDFELAKLLDGSPSVSSEWPEDPYRAPEVDGGGATIQSDLYSFGKLAVAAAAGGKVDDTNATVALGKASVPKRLAKYLVDCLEPVPKKRPPELSVLLKELTRWAEKGI